MNESKFYVVFFLFLKQKMSLLKIHFLILIQLLSCNKKPDQIQKKDTHKISSTDYSTYHSQAETFCKENNFNQNYYYLIDLSIHSGKNRFFIYDFKSKKIINENLVTHGSCDVKSPNATKWEKAKFSDENDSHCSSLGKYKIGKRDYSSWGIKIKYWLHGLDSTNRNAVKRVVVLHSWEAVSDTEIYPEYSPISWGCPAVSDSFMKILDTQLKISKQPVLLWIIK